MIVTVYGDSTCPNSARLRRWLDEKGVEYTGLLIDKNPHAASQLIQHGEESKVPFTVVSFKDGGVKKFSGFCPEALSRALAK